MSEEELDAVKSTGMLRGGREGTTYFTDSYFKNANKAKSRLALPQKPSYVVEFEKKIIQISLVEQKYSQLLEKKVEDESTLQMILLKCLLLIIKK